ncbi:MAG: 50S ribosomal protein L17 [Muribaculaceae bacterium]|nr:50S ribosomal protein L17 [Muribaculaceae bacterium]
MRHNKSFNHLSRKKAHRDALLANMTISLIMHKRIFTTLAKAKALRVYAEPLINRAKVDSTPNRRLVFSHLQNKEAVTELFREIAQKIAERNGGYTRILKTGNRLGDNAKMCFIELVDYNENMLNDKPAKKGAGKTRRSRRSSRPAAEAPAAPAAEAPAAEEAKAE